MKFYFILLTILVAFFFNMNLIAQEETTEQNQEDWESETYIVEDEALKYYQEKYEKEYDALFEDVYNAIKTAISENMNCMLASENQRQDENGLYKGTIKSDYCVLTVGSDTTLPVMKRFSLDFPVIRGGVWVNGRVQYKFMLKEKEDGGTYLLMKVELSGKEEYVTREVKFWKSNGVLEKEMFEYIDAALGIEQVIE